MGKVKFSIRTDKADINGKCPIQMLYYLEKKRKYHWLEERVLPHAWDKKFSKVVFLSKKEAAKIAPSIDYNLFPTNAEADRINSEMIRVKHLISEREYTHKMSNSAYSADTIVSEFKGSSKGMVISEERPGLVESYIKQYIEDHKDKRKKGSLVVYKNLWEHLKGFKAKTCTNVTFKEIDARFFSKFESYLISLRAYKVENGVSIQTNRPQLFNIAIAKILSTLKTFINYAKKNGVEINPSYKDFSIKNDTSSLEVVALTSDEFEALRTLDLSKNDRLDRARDVFVFAASTGFRIGDLKDFRRVQIKNGEITKVISKTNQIHTIPLNSVSSEILNKYSGMLKPLPLTSEQKINRAIKEVCKLAGIDSEIEISRKNGNEVYTNTYPKYQLVSIHTARKSFCTIMLEKGVPAETVMKLSGHTSYSSFKRYINIAKETKEKAMHNVFGMPTRVKNTKLIAK